ncbi:MAG: Uma2 family endonuclease [Anaerolineae bacterium]|nr:Uma2 family endonuclease [Anaerolineae bacterium]
MATQEKLYTVDDLWAMESDPAYEDRYFYLIDGRLYEDNVPGRIHARLAVRISRYLDEYSEAHGFGQVTSECAYHPPETPYTAILPDLPFQSYSKLPDPPPERYVPQMPDLAVEIQSPTDSRTKMLRKAQASLENGTALVWLVQPKTRGVDVCR